ncbi:hypothetical protein LUX39_32085 [Actinomadura madurae]|nr:hypothetical protein [Actinomadura madurae]MCP9952417.1 hypothetical protein [Actinomadura madurae]MCP9981654.1 hypothetical protein [Actinomadura madurae]MCQ0006838.1 hypothetical protein [Actinomadura madurae]MCQ0017854.1 hypothetical protein [Actinomadura madurae]
MVGEESAAQRAADAIRHDHRVRLVHALAAADHRHAVLGGFQPLDRGRRAYGLGRQRGSQCPVQFCAPHDGDGSDFLLGLSRVGDQERASPPVPQTAGDGGHRPPADGIAQPQLVQRADAVRHDHDAGARLPEFGAALVQQHLVPRPAQADGCRHAAQTRSHHDHSHRFSLPLRSF